MNLTILVNKLVNKKDFRPITWTEIRDTVEEQLYFVR